MCRLHLIWEIRIGFRLGFVSKLKNAELWTANYAN